MKLRTSKYKPKTREDISNPHWRISHTELLKMAKVKTSNGEFQIKSYENGRIIVTFNK